MKTLDTPAPARAPARARRLAVALALVLLPAATSAQETDTVRLGAPDTLRPVPADTFVLVDSILEPADTLTVERDSLAVDTVPPPRLVPLALRRPLEPGFSTGVVEWNRAELLRSTALTVADLLERVPGLARVRAGWYPQPELVVSPGSLPGDVEVLLDGFPLDPLTSTTVDLGRIGITDLERVRVERRGGRLRIELTQLEHPEPRTGYETTPDSGAAYTRVEIVSGDLDTDGIAGVFMAPRFLFGPFAAALSRLNSDGFQRREPGQVTSAWLRWSYLRDRWGLHAEYRRNGVERSGASALPGEATREDVILRARVRPWQPLTAEVYAGHSEVDDVFVDSVSTELSGTHVGARAAFDRPWLGAQGALRIRNGDVGPGLSYELAADAHALPWLSVNGAFEAETWDRDDAATWSAGVAVGPFLGARLFADLSDGSHGIRWLGRPGGGTPIVERSRQRAGIDWVLGGWRLGAAAFRAEGDSVAPAALPGIGVSGDRALALYPGFDVQGVELSARLPLPYDFALEGNYTRIEPAGGGILAVFQPVDQGRGGLVWHSLPLEGTQLEVDARAEFEYRGAMLVPAADPGTFVTVDATPRFNLDLNIRVLDIHAYVSWQNILNEQELNDLPARFLPGQTAYFGVKWELWN